MKTFCFIVFCLVVMASCSGCIVQFGLEEEHNKQGGYIPACDDKPGMIGDDC